MTRTLTTAQAAARDARRAQFKALAQRIGAMSLAERTALVEHTGTLITIAGHPLSLHNACMVACQAPTATVLGGYRQWQAAGRHVRAGEHGLMIWAPTARPDDPNRQEGEHSSHDRQNFICITVFDIAQTESSGDVVAQHPINNAPAIVAEERASRAPSQLGSVDYGDTAEDARTGW